MNHPLQYLLFDASDDGEGTGTRDAMASARAADLCAVLAELGMGQGTGGAVLLTSAEKPRW